MSASGSNSRLAIFEFSDFFIPGSVIDLIIKIKRGTGDMASYKFIITI
ncbi:MAG: hypothetical protein Ct9H90mP6_09590 [Gammaproteobacteria bacterium]|nr:MAG: hypothetical protein Ct9H90mP6_09590 [Gammaproteobacteria bacterium]